ncbi:translation initiation factor 4B [Microsporum canis CBS 113480]|uniref:Translation initiation factor 4B n=1 Tax=Arthroderma otae (strain ATCC MYA-4605 / CBS 113480) TaxID=554155 RepID=C5FMB4_ARTOC|nr:translation initiation factor 4B [Microsporum canis CBS 113480]EEQ31017.1 translation initiation factor 4B [Microsporum canis CBS 113480]
MGWFTIHTPLRVRTQRSKAQKMSIGTFLADETYGSWADEMEDNPIPLPSYAPRSGYGGERNTYGTSGGYAQEHTERSYHTREELPMPTQPPYTAHIGNLSFEATQADIQELFAECEVTSVRIVEDKLTGSPKGFGYVEFASVDGLKKALTFQGTSLQGRNIRVSIAEPPKDRHEARDLSDWTRKGPLPELPGQRRVSDRAGFGGPVSEVGSDRVGRRGYEAANDGRSRDFSNWERKGPLSPSLQNPPAREGRPNSKEGPQFRRASPAWGEGRSQDGSRPPRREFTERPVPERAPTAPELDNQWRARMRPDAPAQPETPVEPPTPTTGAAPAPGSRPRLNLQKRTIPEPEGTATPPAATETKSSIFGGAKPIDTASREKEVAEKRELALQQKKEADEKAKAERIEKQKAEKAAKEEAEKAEANGAKEDTPEGEKSVEILRREEGEEKAAADGEKGTGAQKADSGPEKSRPQLQSRTSSGWRNGGGRGRGGPPHSRGGSRSTSHRGPPAEAASPASPATPDEDGWSTVSAKQKNVRRGNQYNRGQAS